MTSNSGNSSRSIAIQGILGAFSHEACREIEENPSVVSFDTFEETIESVRDGSTNCAVLPIENSTYGRVADLHHLLPESNLFITAEHFMPVRLQLLGCPGAKISDIRVACSHAVALGQCRAFLRRHGIRPEPVADTAGAARLVAEQGDPARAAIASRLAGEIYGLEPVAENIHDNEHNTTRFLVMARRPLHGGRAERNITTFVFGVRNIPAALYKALGGFATNGVNMVKLESYMVGGSFTATQFYSDIEGHPEDHGVSLAMDELRFFCTYTKILGVYEAHPHRYRYS